MIDSNQQALLELLKASLFGMKPSFPEVVDWDAVLKEAQDQTVVALAAPAVPTREAEKMADARGKEQDAVFTDPRRTDKAIPSVR